MKKHFSSRREFLRTGLAGCGFTTLLSVPCLACAAAVRSAKPRFKGLKLGIASYSLRKFNLDQALEMTRQAGVNYITLKDVHLSMKSTPEELAAARKKIAAAGVVLMGGGVIYLKNMEGEIQAAFEYARGAGMPVMVCSPATEALDLVEKYAKQYDLQIAIHNHGPGDERYPSPLDVLALVKRRDARMGICMDLGHTVRLNQDPVAVMRKCAGRLYDFHIKDVSAPDPKGVSTEVGKGVVAIPAVLKELVQMKFGGLVALEYEANGDAPMTGILESLAYIRGVLDTL